MAGPYQRSVRRRIGRRDEGAAPRETAVLVAYVVIAASLLVTGIYLVSGALNDELVYLFVGQLAITSWVVSQIYRIRRSPELPLWRDPAQLWAVIAIGFAFLALDEALSIHESLDELLHSALGWEETAVTDRIDDLIILAYGLAGLAFLYWNRAEALRCRVALPWLSAGFVLLVATVILDVVTNRDDLLGAMIADEQRMNAVHVWLARIEEAAEVFAQTAFLLAFLTCLRALGRQAPLQETARR